MKSLDNFIDLIYRIAFWREDRNTRKEIEERLSNKVAHCRAKARLGED